MAGTVYHLSGVVSGTSTSELTADTFYWLRKGFDNHGGFTRIASYYGVNGVGLGRSDGSDGGLSGDCRWAVYRKTTGTDIFDVWIAANENAGSPTSTDPSGSYYIGGLNTGIGFCVAWHSSGEAWSGSVNNNGQDSFLSPWKSDAVILPRSNGIWGVHSGSRNNLAALKYISPTTYPFLNNSGTLHVLGDSDNFIVFGDGGELTPTPDDAIYSLFGSVVYVNPASSSFNLPYLMLAKSDGNSTGIRRGSVFDNYSLDGPNAGMWISKPQANIPYNSNSFGYGLDWDVVGTDVALPKFDTHPVSGSGSYTHEHPILVFATNPFMYVGYLDFIRAVSPQYQSGDRLNSGSRAVIGFGSNVSSEKTFTSCSIPWSSSFGLVTAVSGTMYLSGTVFLTSSLHGYTHVTQSFLYDTIVSGTVVKAVYRALNGGIFTYDIDNIPPGTDLVLIGRFKQP